MTENKEKNPAADVFLDFVAEAKSQGKDIDLVQATVPAGLPSDQLLAHLAAQFGCEIVQIHKTVCLNYKDAAGRHLIAVIVPANCRVSMAKVEQVLKVNKVKAAQRDFIENETGFVPGGIPPIGFAAIRLVDESVFKHQTIFAGGGNNLDSYTRLSPQTLLELDPELKVGDFLE